MGEFGDKHRGHSIDRGTTLLVNGSQNQQWIEFLNHHLRTAVGQAVHRGKHHTETMEQRNAYAKFVILRESHVLSCKPAVIRDVIVGKHHTFGESRSSAGVLHIYHVMTCDVAFCFVQFLIVNIASQKQQLGRIEHSAVFLHTYVNNVFHIGETLALQMSALAGAKFRKHIVGHVHIIALPSSVGDAECMHIRVFAKIFQLSLFVVGVHRYEHSSDFCRSIEES